MALNDNLDRVRERIHQAAVKVNRRPEEIKLIAVSKTVAADRMIEAIRAGVTILGENRVQEAKQKWLQIEQAVKSAHLEFHLIGHLQRNKAKEAVKLFDLIHSLDSTRLTIELDQRAGEVGKVQRVLVEVNTSGEVSKSGIEPDRVLELVETIRLCKNLKLEGLMTIGPLLGGETGARHCFQMLRRLRDQLGGAAWLPELSMGMTQDFEIAIEAGATMVRIGTAIFGVRN